MKPISWVGIVLIVLGALALAYQGFDYTRQEKVLNVGPIHATAEEQKHVSIPPVLGGLVLVGGIVLGIGGGKKRSKRATRVISAPEEARDVPARVSCNAQENDGSPGNQYRPHPQFVPGEPQFFRHERGAGGQQDIQR